ncbi:ParA family protein [Desulfofarcimen acetoxidans]|uniref:ParA family protein n=1 Tax=Desulfofarcimen acetoxidans TaxID=58138 RepID=UPI00019E52CB|nr:AAA family ATPase [Desulfofarcimen acetoxidans]
METKIISVSNQKGGTGKTTTSINVGACLASLGQKTLLIDLDPQANLTTGLGIDVHENEPTVYDLLKGLATVKIARKSEIKNLYVIPSGIELAAAEAELMGEIGREQQLRTALSRVEGYDYIIIDTAPTLGVLMLNALSA